MSEVEARSALPETRRAALLEELNRTGTVRISELTDRLGVTAVTLRRDITQLVEEGLMRRIHGGAALVEASAGTAASTAPAAPPPSGSIGVLVPSLDYYWPEVVRGAEDEAVGFGLEVVLRGSSYEGGEDRPQLLRLLEHPGVRALVAAPSPSGPDSPAVLAWLSGLDVPVVLMERAPSQDSFSVQVESVVTDHALGATMAVQHLARLGHRRIGIAVDESSPTSPHLHRGWASAVHHLGVDRSSVVDAAVPTPGSEASARATEQVLQECLSTGTSAVLFHAEAEAVALVQHAERLGVRVPEDLSVVAYDDAVAELFTPRLTAVRPPRRSIGRAAVSLLGQRLADPGRPAHHVTISPSLRVRESTAPPRQTPR